MRGEKNLLVVPISFVTEHIETLHEINIEAREQAEKLGVRAIRNDAGGGGFAAIYRGAGGPGVARGRRGNAARSARWLIKRG